jgi:hypothetical protein
MKRICSFLALVMSVAVAVAGPIDYNRAQQIAKGFLNKDRAMKVDVEYVAQEMEVNGLHGATSRYPSYYVFNAAGGDGFVLVSGDDAFPLVLGYSDTGTFRYSDDMPLALRRMLSSFDDYVEDVRLGLEEAPDVEEMIRQASFTVVPEMIDSKWSQYSPYNSLIPKSGGSSCPVGCVATAMSQIMRYYRYPVQPVYTGSKKWNVSGNKNAGSFNFKDITFDYGNMPVKASASSSTAQKNAVALLCAAACASVDMQLAIDGSGAFDSDAMQAYYEIFGYSKASLAVVYRECYATQEEWNQLIYDEIMAGRPVQMGAVSDPGGSGDGAGHSFILDGIDSRGYLHVNWGWGGGSDAYYAIPYMNPKNTTYTFSQDQCAIIGIQLPKADNEVVRQTSVYCYQPLAVFMRNTLRNSDFKVFLGEFYNYYNTTHTYTIGVGLFDHNGQFLENVCTENTEDMTVELDAYYGVVDTVGIEFGGQLCLIPRSYPDGNYTLRLITLEDGYSEWREPDMVGGIALNQIPIVLSSTQIRFNASSTAIHDVESSDWDEEGRNVEYYSVDGTRISRPAPGQIFLEKRKNRQGQNIVTKKIEKNNIF